MDAGGINVTGIASSVWSNPARTLTIGGGNVVGSTLQAPVQPGALSLTTVQTQTILTFTGAGVVINMGLATTTAFSAGAVTANLLITIDGGSALSIPFMTGAMTLTSIIKAICTQTAGNGANVNDFVNLQFGIQFATSILIQLQVTASTLTQGSVTPVVLYAHV